VEAMTNLKKVSKGHKIVEETLDVKNSCWELITLLWKLDIIRYDSSDNFDLDKYLHQSRLVSMWDQLYEDMCNDRG
jgi:hypothetical protein